MRLNHRTRGTWPAATALALLAATAMAGQAYRSPEVIVLTPDGKTGYVSDHTADSIVVLDTGEKPAKKAEWNVGGGPSGLVLSPDGKTLYVALNEADAVAAVDTASGKVTKTVPVGRRPEGLALAPKANRLYVCNRLEDTVSMIDLGKMAEQWRVKAVREPFWVQVTSDESRIVVTNALPVGPATESSTGCVVSIIDAKAGQTATHVQLPGGSTNARMVVLSPDGKWAYLAHGVSRFQVPTTQLERGWMNTAALSIVNVPERSHYATVLLDSIDLGAADPYGLSLSEDGKELWVSFSGPHEVARIEVARLVEMLGGKIPDKYGKPIGTANTNPWADIKKDAAARYQLVNDLMAVYFAELIVRYPSTGKRYLWKPGLDLSFGKGPHCLALHPDGKRVFSPNYYGGTVTVLGTERGKLLHTVEMGEQPEPDMVRKGETIFHDASLCFQHWQSCSTCHPKARMDGLRWDLLNDGMGNHKKTRSLVKSHQTSPVMSLGVRAKAEVGVRAGFKYILFAVVPEETAAAVDAYLKSREPEPSPYLVDGKLSAAAARGKEIFEGKAKCADCHTGPLYTDQKKYDVGTEGVYDQGQSAFYTPKLIELYRVAPYLHDGRAATLEEVLPKFNPDDKHGVTSKLSEQEIADLVEYLNSL
ncbi:MAG: beta-propeller fold lactonase family protein [Planctomycetota bacterium]